MALLKGTNHSSITWAGNIHRAK